ncbi:MAG: universal stress protein [Bacteroidetes bacterium]|nr:universal stress protein [Bacteroidota bacterium]
MVTVKNIMVTTDLSVASYSAMEYAAWLAKKEKAGIILFYSVDNLPTVAYHTVDLTFDKFREEILAFERKRLKEFAAQFKPLFTGPFKTVITEGNAAQSIVQYANQNSVDMIVMSTHGRTGIQHVLLGSVAERVVRTAHCPVLTVKSTEAVQKDSAAKKARKSSRKQ